MGSDRDPWKAAIHAMDAKKEAEARTEAEAARIERELGEAMRDALHRARQNLNRMALRAVDELTKYDVPQVPYYMRKKEWKPPVRLASLGTCWPLGLDTTVERADSRWGSTGMMILTGRGIFATGGRFYRGGTPMYGTEFWSGKQKVTTLSHDAIVFHAPRDVWTDCEVTLYPGHKPPIGNSHLYFDAQGDVYMRWAKPLGDDFPDSYFKLFDSLEELVIRQVVSLISASRN